LGRRAAGGSRRLARPAVQEVGEPKMSALEFLFVSAGLCCFAAGLYFAALAIRVVMQKQ